MCMGFAVGVFHRIGILDRIGGSEHCHGIFRQGKMLGGGIIGASDGQGDEDGILYRRFGWVIMSIDLYKLD